MAPYCPPIAHYAHLDVSMYPEEHMLYCIGKEGKGFYNQTERLGLEYLWWNQELNVVELWGSFKALESGAKQKLKRWIAAKQKVVSS